MSNSLPTPEQAPVLTHRLCATFDKREYLEEIGKDLQSKGVISGFNIVANRASYTHEGKEVQQLQFMLIITTEDSEKADIVYNKIFEKIRLHWDVPFIMRDTTESPHAMYEFLAKAKTEHEQIVAHKRVTKIWQSVAAALALALAALGTKLYSDHQAHTARDAATEEAYQRVKKMSAGVEGTVFEGNGPLRGQGSLSERFEHHYKIIGHDPDGKPIFGWIIPTRSDDGGVDADIAGQPLPKELWQLIEQTRALERDMERARSNK